MNNNYRNTPYQTPRRGPIEQMPSRGYGMPVGHYMNKNLVMIIQDCAANCEHMMHHIDTLPDCNNRRRQSELLNDCADICDLTAKYAARDSYFAKQAAAYCARVCDICGNECLKYPDEMSQHCAQICFECARHCISFAQSGM